MKTLELTKVRQGNKDDTDYHAFIERLNNRFITNSNNGQTPIFETDAKNLWETFLNNIPEDQRQFNNCHCCRHFIERYAGLVIVDPDGSLVPAMWNINDAPEEYKTSIFDIIVALQKSKITNVFVSSEKVYGTPTTGNWSHLAIKPSASMIYKNASKTAFQHSVEKSEDFKNVMYALSEFPEKVVKTALTILEADTLYRSEKVLGQAQFLDKIHAIRKNSKNTRNKVNLSWQEIATAPAGFCHPKSSMIGTLLEDIAKGLAFEDIKKRFASKMYGLNYQCPKAPPTSGAIEAAEKAFEKLGAQRSLGRRFARLDDVKALWKPKEVAQESNGVFGHLKPKDEKAIDLVTPPKKITWVNFLENVLPNAEEIQIFVSGSRQSFSSLLTAEDMSAPPILQWDNEENRNPVSHYFYHGGRLASDFNLSAQKFHKVNAVCLKPSMWKGEYSHHAKGVMFIIDGCKDLNNDELCLFPETLKSEFHGMRSVIEAYSKTRKASGHDQQSAAGLMFTDTHQEWKCLVSVKINDVIFQYSIDRWE